MTKIEWADEVWNPVTGCTKVSAGCKNCYAETIAKRFWGDRKFTDVQLHPERLKQPLKRKKPTIYFVNSMSDLFHEDISDLFISKVLYVTEMAEQHQFLILTKRAKRMFNYIKYYGKPSPNVMLGVSVEDQATADERIPILLQTPAAKRFVSYEPALGYINFRWMIGPNRNKSTSHLQVLRELDLIIMGGESGPGYRSMDLDWARHLRDQCKAAGTAFFFKQTAGKGPIPEDLQIREWPE